MYCSTRINCFGTVESGLQNPTSNNGMLSNKTDPSYLMNDYEL